ncbi:hypothetical protein CKO12_14525, partial [Chromatium okenii]|nr:hypothetical protein [Chromatium okenii]
IPEFGTLLHKHFWLHGHGHFEISKAGSYLDRGVFDTSVWQPSRIDFAGGAVCAAQVEQRLPPPQVINPDAPLDIKACIERLQLDDNQNACLNELKATARLELADQAQQIRASWMQNRIQEMTTHKALDPTVAENVLRQAIEKQVLSGDFLITLQSGDVVTVDEILADQKRYHGQRCADPVERDYDLGHR